jgi:hypothetical protein
MAVPHYAYLVLKIPGPNRVIIVKGNFKDSDICDKEFHQMAQTFGMTAEYARLNSGFQKSLGSPNRSREDNIYRS